MKVLHIAVIVVAAFLLAGAANDPGDRFSAYLTGADVRPQVDTDTEGRFFINFNEEETSALTYFRVNDGVGITEAHLHCDDPRLTDPSLTTLFDLISEGDDIERAVERFFVDDEIIAAQARRSLGDAFLGSPCGVTNLRELRQAIINGGIYVDVHSVGHPAGEIRGQVSFFGEDTDGDGIIDRRDADIDGDGIPNEEDSAPFRSALGSAPPPQGAGGSASPQGASGKKLLEETYADIPWHQKLSTKDSNLIDIPIVMPYDAIPFNQIGDESCKKVTDPIQRSRCMLRYGIVNIMGMHRTDTLYDPAKDTIPANCPDTKDDCVEVKLKVQRFHTATRNSAGFEADVIRNNRYVSPDKIIVDGKLVPKFSVISLGYAITEATMFTPWLPWYTGHYCAQEFDGVHDSVCYEDYFTTMIQATADSLEGWLTEFPDVFVPRGQQQFRQFCQAGEVFCDLFLGKVNWLKDGTGWATDPIVRMDPSCEDKTGKISNKECQAQVEDRTDNLVNQFNASIGNENYFFDDTHHYPWEEGASTNRAELQEAIQTNPFIGAYDLTWDRLDPQGAPNEKTSFSFFTGKPYVLPKRCFPSWYFWARQGATNQINDLKECAIDFEIHTNGFFEQWGPLFGVKQGEALPKEAIDQIFDAETGFTANQYGRTMFLYAGVWEQHVAVSFKKLEDGMSVHDKVYGSSMYTQYLPLVNPADLSLLTKSYTDAYWHNMVMSNHMNQTIDHFIRGIRGRTLWHNEFRSRLLWGIRETKPHLKDNKLWQALEHVDFPAGFQAVDHTAPFHGNTCDSCHIRNGSGIPLRPNMQLPQIHEARGMNLGFNVRLDETYSNNTAATGGKDTVVEIPAMKIVLFDLGETEGDQCDVNDHTIPNSPPQTLDPQYYTNKIMNFYGNSLHVNQEKPDANNGRLTRPTYNFRYQEIKNGDGFELVDTTSRQSYKTWYVEITDPVDFGSACKDATSFNPRPNNDVNWPTQCNEVIGPTEMKAALNDRPQPPSETTTKVGHMHLLGHRLGNGPLIEMIPNQTIMDTQTAQAKDPANGGITYPGCYGLAAGTRGGGSRYYRSCATGEEGECYLSRFGWVGDRASLEDQIANAATVEMNITSKESYKSINPNPNNARELVRYKDRLCGPADKNCTGEKGKNLDKPNSDITEQEIKDMATYQRWIGIPNRSEYQVSSTIVQEGEKVFKELQCHSCHVIDKITYVDDDNMLPDEERARLSILQRGQSDYPFISYLGTDLLLHDMGYLSQVAKAPAGVTIRNPDGTVKEAYKAWVQKIRTPALKGLRFNRFVTDSIHNTKTPFPPSIHNRKDGPFPNGATPACDFLLHDGRACDAIEAAYLHDGPAIKALEMIEKLNNLIPEKLKQLRAFLYSL